MSHTKIVPADLSSPHQEFFVRSHGLLYISSPFGLLVNQFFLCAYRGSNPAVELGQVSGFLNHFDFSRLDAPNLQILQIGNIKVTSKNSSMSFHIHKLDYNVVYLLSRDQQH